MLEQIIKELNINLKNTVKGYKSMGVCDIESEKVLFTESLDENFNIELLSAYNIDVMKSKLNALEIIGIDNTLNDIVFNLDDEVHIISVTENKKFFIYLAVEGKDIDVTFTRYLLDTHKFKLNKIANQTLAL